MQGVGVGECWNVWDFSRLHCWCVLYTQRFTDTSLVFCPYRSLFFTNQRTGGGNILVSPEDKSLKCPNPSQTAHFTSMPERLNTPDCHEFMKQIHILQKTHFFHIIYTSYRSIICPIQGYGLYWTYTTPATTKTTITNIITNYN